MRNNNRVIKINMRRIRIRNKVLLNKAIIKRNL